MYQVAAYRAASSFGKKAKRKAKNLSGIKFSQILNVGLIFIAVVAVVKIYNFFFSADLVEDKELDTSEKETLEGLQTSPVIENDLTINHTRANTIALIIRKELSAAAGMAILYNEDNIDRELRSLTIADLTLVCQKFGVMKIKVNTIFGMGGDVLNVPMKTAASHLLTQNDFKHLSSYFNNVKAYL